MGEDFDARTVADRLAYASGAPVLVVINSPGGAAAEGAAIHAELAAYAGRITVRVAGMAASAALLIAMAGDEIEMTAGALMMIHDPARFASTGRGTADDHRRDAAGLDAMAAAYAQVYADRTGLPVDRVREMMRNETWMTADEAVSMGFADRVAAAAEPTAPAPYDYARFTDAPAELRALAL